MDPRFSLKVYPRKDVVYKTKSSYNFETIRAKVYLDRKTSRRQDFYRWLIHAIIGFLVGIIAFIMAYMEEALALLRSNITQNMLNEQYNMQQVWAFYTFSGVFFAFLAVLLTVYIGPYAAGSGVPEVMGLLNGVSLSGATDISTLIIKVLGVVLAVVGNLCVGKEGPLVHIGAIVGLMIPYLPFDSF